MAEGKARIRSTAGEEAQVVTTDDGQLVDTATGEILDDAAQGGGWDAYQESPFDELNQDTWGFDDSQLVRDEFSQVRPGEGTGRVIGAGRAA